MKWTCGVVVVDVIPKHSCFFRGEIWRVVPAAPVPLASTHSLHSPLAPLRVSRSKRPHSPCVV